jgi:LmbE family N-acetylglucosaminyl deacetylase
MIGADDTKPTTTTMDLSPSSLLSTAATTSALVGIAQPDDERSGLGAVVSALVAEHLDVRAWLLYPRRGEHARCHSKPGHASREELARAADVIGISDVVLGEFRDGQLATVPDVVLDDLVDSMTRDGDLIVVFEPSGETGHPDDCADTAAGEHAAVPDLHHRHAH